VAFLDLIADVSGLTAELRESRLALVRIAEALERISPPLPEPPEPGEVPTEQVHYMADSPEQYAEKQDKEAALAISLGVAPWSPAFQTAVLEMKSDMMKPRYEFNGEGQRVELPPYSEAEAEDLLRSAFREARALENQR